MSYRCSDIRKRCETKAEADFRSTKETNGWIRLDGKKACRVTIPKGRCETRPGTLNSIRKQLGFDSMDDFGRFMDCSLDKDQYFALLQEKKSD
jgi:hypothetical protein